MLPGRHWWQGDTAIEALNVLYDEHLIENAADSGEYLLSRLHELHARYPRIIKDVRGKGLMVGLEFQDFSKTLPAPLRPFVIPLDERYKGSVAALFGSLLLHDHDILVAFTEYNRNVIRLEPPLICQRVHIDVFINAIEQLLSQGIVSVVKDFAKTKVR